MDGHVLLKGLRRHVEVVLGLLELADVAHQLLVLLRFHLSLVFLA